MIKGQFDIASYKTFLAKSFFLANDSIINVLIGIRKGDSTSVFVIYV